MGTNSSLKDPLLPRRSARGVRFSPDDLEGSNTTDLVREQVASGFKAIGKSSSNEHPEISFFERHTRTYQLKAAHLKFLVSFVFLVSEFFTGLWASENYDEDKSIVDSITDFVCSMEIYDAIINISLALIVIGNFLHVVYTYPSFLLKASLYKNDSATAPTNFLCWPCSFCGTFMLFACLLRLIGSLGFMVGCISTRSIRSPVSFLIFLASYFQYTSNFPERIVSPFNGSFVNWLSKKGLEKFSAHIGSDFLISAWLWMLIGFIWLVSESVAIDYNDKASEFSSWFGVVESLILIAASYFELKEGYKEGTRLDGLLIDRISVAKRVYQEDERSSSIPSHSTLSPNLGAAADDHSLMAFLSHHPLANVVSYQDPSTMNEKDIVSAAISFLNRAGEWELEGNEGVGVEGVGELMQVFRSPCARMFKTEISEMMVHPIVFAETLRSIRFKKFACTGDPAKFSIEIVEKISGQTVLYSETRGPDPPIPPSEMTYASTIQEISDSVIAVVEWGVFYPGSNWLNSNRKSEIKTVKLDPFRVFLISRNINAGYFAVQAATWEGSLLSWLPQSLADTEVQKFPEILDDLIEFLRTDSLAMESRDVEEKMWQKANRKISPLMTGVMVRVSASYRLLVSQFSGIKSKVPDPIPILPMHVHPFRMISRKFEELINENRQREAIIYSLAFCSTEFEDWKQSEVKEGPSRTRVVTWRRKLEDEKTDPFRIQVKVKGGDPLSLARLILKEKFTYKQTSKKFPVLIEEVNKNLCVFHQVIKGVGTKDREVFFVNYFQEISSTKALVVSISVDNYPSLQPNPKNVVLSKFLVYICELEGGADTRVTISGLVPQSGFYDKLLSWAGDSDVRKSRKFFELTAQHFSETAEGRKLLNDVRMEISSSCWKDIIDAMSPLEIDFLSQFSEVYSSGVMEAGNSFMASASSPLRPRLSDRHFGTSQSSPTSDFASVVTSATARRKYRSYGRRSTGFSEVGAYSSRGGGTSEPIIVVDDRSRTLM